MVFVPQQCIEPNRSDLLEGVPEQSFAYPKGWYCGSKPAQSQSSHGFESMSKWFVPALC